MIQQSSTYATAEGFAAMLRHRSTAYLQEAVVEMAASGIEFGSTLEQFRAEIAARGGA